VQSAAVSVCLSVRLAVCHVRVVRIKTSNHISNTTTYDDSFTGTSLTVALITGSMKNRDFRPKTRFISEMIPDRDVVTLERE